LRPHGSTWLAWGSLAAYVVLAAAGMLLLAQTPPELVPASDEPAPLAGDVLFAVVILLFAAVGALIAARRPRHPIGWLLCAGGVLNGLSFLALGYARLGLIGDPGSVPAPEALAVVHNLANDAQWGLFVVMLLLFPNGRLPSRRWRPLLWLMIALMVAELLDSALQPGALEGFALVENPLGVAGAGFLGQVDFDLIGMFGLFAVLASLLVRHRSGTAEERQQLKAFLFALGVVMAMILVADLVDALIPLSRLAIDLIGFVIVAMFGGVAVALGVAILRYRLYDIDLVINRALVYGVLTTTLAAAYLGSVLLLQLALSPLTERSDLAIAGSTLAVAALFGPARRRIQAVVDRRFYRRRYDAARTLESFGAQLRDEVDLDALGGELRAVASRTMQPASISLWLRGGSARG
jgi:hypothetical protein